MKFPACVFFLLLGSLSMYGQYGVEARISDEDTVSAHKENLTLTLLIDSVQVGKKTYKLNFKKTLRVSYETDYLQVKDDIFIKIFISRNQEYGRKFYSWKWDYLRKKGDKFLSQGIGYYAPIEFNQPIPEEGNYGQGVGVEGDSNYLMFYYRSRLE